MTSKLGVTVGLVAGPTITLIAHELIYLGSMQECTMGVNPAAHAIPAVGLLLIAYVAFVALRHWRQSSESVIELAYASPNAPSNVAPATLNAHHDPRAHFLSALTVGLCALSAIVLAGQWLGMVFLGTCTRQ